MGLIRASVTIPEDVYEEAKKLSDNFSSLLTEALREYFKKTGIEKAKKSFGSWKDREKDSTSIVNKIRTDRGRDYVSRSN